MCNVVHGHVAPAQGRVPCPPARVFESICSNGSHAVRSIPARARCRAGFGQGGDSRAGFGRRRRCRADSGHGRDLRATFRHSEHSERPNVARESLQCLNLARQRFQCPDIARQRAACPDSARRRQAFTGTKRARKKFPLPYSVNGRKRRSARVAMRRARGILTHKSLDELSPNHIEHL